MSYNKKSKNTLKKRITATLISVAAIVLIFFFPELSDKLGIYINFNDNSSHVTPTDGDLSVHFIDIGQGDAELIIAPNGEVMLIDSGPTESKDTLTEYLKNYKIKEIKYFILTHPHSDHIGGACQIFDDFCIKNVIMPDAVTTTSTYKNVLQKIDNEKCNVIFAKPSNDIFNLGTAEFVILGPIKNYPDSLNNESVVIRLDYGNTSFIFTGDAEKQSINDLLHFYTRSDLKANVLKIAHHGSSSSTSLDWLSAVSPNFAVISCGKDNDYGHPHREVIELLEKSNIKYFRTDQSGTIVITSNGNLVSVLSPK